MRWKPELKPRSDAQKVVGQDREANSQAKQVIVRHVREEDLPAMEWDGEYTHFRKVYADAFQRMQRGYTVLWVAELPEVGLVGQVFIQLNCDRHELADGEDRAYLYSFRVRQAHRNLGIGTRMMDAVEDDLRRRGFAYVTLNVARNNPRAQQLYVRRGYHVVAAEPGIWSYPDENGVWHQVEEPAWRMEKLL